MEFDLTSLFERAFGLNRGIPYDPSKIQDPKPTKSPAFEAPDTSDDAEGSEFVQMRNTLNSTLPTGRTVFMPIRIGELVLPNEPSISISSRKNIIETALAGSTRRGTVKELIAIEDWQITIRGIALNFNSLTVYPEDQVKALRDLYEQNAALTINCALTSLMGIYRIVIKEFSLPEMIGIQHAQAYQFTCVSDEDFILEL